MATIWAIVCPRSRSCTGQRQPRRVQQRRAADLPAPPAGHRPGVRRPLRGVGALHLGQQHQHRHHQLPHRICRVRRVDGHRVRQAAHTHPPPSKLLDQHPGCRGSCDLTGPGCAPRPHRPGRPAPGPSATPAGPPAPPPWCRRRSGPPRPQRPSTPRSAAAGPARRSTPAHTPTPQPDRRRTRPKPAPRHAVVDRVTGQAGRRWLHNAGRSLIGDPTA